MNRTLRIILAALGVLALVGGLFAQADSASPGQSSRVVLLPFANFAEHPDALPGLMADLRGHLLKRSIELADSAALAEVLRSHRLRNTAELSQAESQTVAREMSARYLLMGSLDRYREVDSTAEVALSARLLDVATGELVWANSVVEHGDPHTRPLGIGAHHAATLAQRATKHLFDGFRFSVPQKQKRVQAIRIKGQNPPERPCRKLVVVTFGNETETHFAGNIFAGELYTALLRRGFSLVDPGRVREVMLESRNLMQGEISRELLQKCREQLDVDFVLTGTVSRFEAPHGQLFEEPAVGFEVRLIDAKRGDVVWAKTYSQEGKDSSWLFNIGYVHGLTVLSRRMSYQLAWDLPVRRARGVPPASSLAEGAQP